VDSSSENWICFASIAQHGATRCYKQIFVRPFVFKKSNLSVGQFEAIRQTFSNSPLLGESTLAGPFESSRGFGCTFHSSGRNKFEERFPAVIPWLNISLASHALESLRPWWRSRQFKRIPNAWYLNVLAVPTGTNVARHVDATLRKGAQVDDAVPEVVSVLYLSVPKGKAGALCLFNGGTRVATIEPKENYCVHFEGHLAHEVMSNEVSGTTRLSLVVEQYYFEDEALARLTEFQLESRAGFGAFLKLHQTVPSRGLQLDE
jgi:hypothetical protein